VILELNTTLPAPAWLHTHVYKWNGGHWETPKFGLRSLCYPRMHQNRAKGAEMAQDKEVTAMGTIAGALAGLDEGATGRVLAWAAQRFGVELQVPARNGLDEGKSGISREEDLPDHGGGFTDFVDLIDAAGPRTDPERALVSAYWFQVVGGAADFPSQQVNEALKDVGQGVGNITDALTKLQRRKPALVRQVAKAGKSRQARKRYKVTAAGIEAVRQMLRGREDE
jgi:hypothetical protein